MDTSEFEPTQNMKMSFMKLIPHQYKNNPLISFEYITSNSSSELELQITFHNCITALDQYKNKSLDLNTEISDTESIALDIEELK